MPAGGMGMGGFGMQSLLNGLGYQMQNGVLMPKPWAGVSGFRFNDASGTWAAVTFADGVISKSAHF
jgi:hypothetical protein